MKLREKLSSLRAARSKKMPTAATLPRSLRVAVKRKMKDMRKARAQATRATPVRATAAVNPAAVTEAARWRSMWTLPRDMTFKQVSGVTGVPVNLLLRENPFGGGPHRGSTLLEQGTVVFTADDGHKPRHPDLPAFTMADSPVSFAFNAGGTSVLRAAAAAAERDTPFPDTPELIRMKVRDVPIPKNGREAAAGPHARKWHASDRVEMDQMFDKGVLEPIHKRDVPADKKAIPGMMVRTCKPTKHGTIRKFKSRFVAKGFWQRYGIDYTETFAPVAAIATIKLVLAVAAHFNMVCFQFDVEGAFLLPDIDHVVYIVDEQGNYYRCHKTLYGLKQSPRVWNQDLDIELKQHGMLQSMHDPCLYTRRTERGWMLMACWVDDCVGACTVPAQRDEFYKDFRYPFSSTSDLDYCLKIKVDHMVDNNGDVLIGLSQPISIEAIAHEYSVQDSNPVSTPMPANAKFSKSQSPSPGTPEHEYMEKVPYRNLLGSLGYIAQITRGDIAFAVNKLAAFSSNPGKAHWLALKRILVYLYHSRHRRLVFGSKAQDFDLDDPTTKPIQIYCDADHGGCLDSDKSTSGTLITVFGDCVNMSSRKQGKVANSTGAAELYAVDDETRNHSAYRSLLFDMTEFYQVTIPTYTDSQVVIKQLDRGELTRRTKHLRLAFNAVKERVADGNIELNHVEGKENPADLFTKPLPLEDFTRHTDFLLNDKGTQLAEWQSCMIDDIMNEWDD